MRRILIVEDDAAILRGLRDNLTYEGYDVVTATNGADALGQIEGDDLDLVVLDVMLPEISGFEVCRRMRHAGIQTPVLMLTARGQEVDRVMGLDLGADDYMTKPFSVPELLARVRAILRRTHPEHPLPDRLSFDDVVVDFVGFEARKGGTPIQLSPKEFGTLRRLAARSGKVVSRIELLHDVWGFERMPTTRTVDNHVASLRAKLEDDPGRPRRIVTIHGVGYKFVTDGDISPTP